MIDGIKVVVARATPVLQLSETFGHCSEAFRKEMNAWLLDLFGVRCTVKQGSAYIMDGGRMLICHPADEAMIREKLRPQGSPYDYSLFGRWLA